MNLIKSDSIYKNSLFVNFNWRNRVLCFFVLHFDFYIILATFIVLRVNDVQLKQWILMLCLCFFPIFIACLGFDTFILYIRIKYKKNIFYFVDLGRLISGYWFAIFGGVMFFQCLCLFLWKDLHFLQSEKAILFFIFLFILSIYFFIGGICVVKIQHKIVKKWDMWWFFSKTNVVFFEKIGDGKYTMPIWFF
jgi:hypothetical protein